MIMTFQELKSEEYLNLVFSFNYFDDSLSGLVGKWSPDRW